MMRSNILLSFLSNLIGYERRRPFAEDPPQKKKSLRRRKRVAVTRRSCKGASIKYVHAEGGGGVGPKADIVLELSKGG